MASPLATTGPVVELGLNFESRERSEEHTSELQSQSNVVCRLLLAKKNSSEQTGDEATAGLHLCGDRAARSSALCRVNRYEESSGIRPLAHPARDSLA